MTGRRVVRRVVAEVGDAVGRTLLGERQVDPRQRRQRLVELHADHQVDQRDRAQRADVGADRLGDVDECAFDLRQRHGVDDQVERLAVDLEAVAGAFDALGGDAALQGEAAAGDRAANHGLEAAVLGEPEHRLVGVALGVDADRRLDDVLDRRLRHAAGDPVARHRAQVALPDLLVVRDHELPAESRTHAPLDPVAEVRRARRARAPLRVGLDVAGHAVDDRLLGQVADAVLERVGHPAIVPADLGVAHRLDDAVFAAAAVDLPVEDLLVLAEDDVAAGLVEGELPVAAALAQAAGAFGLLEHDDAVAVGGEHAREGGAGDAAAEDGDLHGLDSEGGAVTRRPTIRGRARRGRRRSGTAGGIGIGARHRGRRRR